MMLSTVIQDDRFILSLDYVWMLLSSWHVVYDPWSRMLDLCYMWMFKLCMDDMFDICMDGCWSYVSMTCLSYVSLKCLNYVTCILIFVCNIVNLKLQA
jgi:hypothetical protein